MSENKGRSSKKTKIKVSSNINKNGVIGKDNIKVTKNSIFNKKYVGMAMIVLILLIIVIIISSINKKIEVNEQTNISTLDSSKYKEEILTLYNRDNEEDKFLKEMNKVQTSIGTYLITNSTLNENSFSDLVKKLNNEINNDYSDSLDLSKSTYYNGKYSIDDAGNLKFKFANKSIEPEWLKNDNLKRYVIFN